ncbi:MAG: hypothetical protein ACTSXP_14595, partial [Promethearchaeota archaeon]
MVDMKQQQQLDDDLFQKYSNFIVDLSTFFDDQYKSTMQKVLMWEQSIKDSFNMIDEIRQVSERNVIEILRCQEIARDFFSQFTGTLTFVADPIRRREKLIELAQHEFLSTEIRLERINIEKIIQRLKLDEEKG